jgi:hypothetical protein
MSITDNVSQNLDGRQYGKTVEYQAHTPADKPRFQLGPLSVPRVVGEGTNGRVFSVFRAFKDRRPIDRYLEGEREKRPPGPGDRAAEAEP